ncbi:MAG: Rne/Rng family ribonuclease [Candidatus Omnitrophica bacterium]|nr:Rne/Rng family ribonuclease [Candidatus Omnitrophota bacterium]
MNTILINTEHYETRVAVVSTKGNLEEFYLERKGEARLAGNIYKGIIRSVLPGMGAIFVDLGTDKNGFLYISSSEEKTIASLLDEEPDEERAQRKKRKQEFISRLKKGQELYVQVVKEPIGTKGPLLTTDISIPGKYIVFMPFNDTRGVSKRIEEKDKRTRIRDFLEKLELPKGAGCIARTQSAYANLRELKLEARYLSNLWSRTLKRAVQTKAPCLIHGEYELGLRIVRDVVDEKLEKIVVDDKQEYKKIIRYISSVKPTLRRKIFYHHGKAPIYEKYGVEGEIDKLYRRKVPLKSGGSIVIQQTEGLVAIDVNTGKFTGSRNLEDTTFRNNMEAAEEIARQIMLRDLGGIIVIDFIDMNRRDHRRRVHDILAKSFRLDKAKINISEISQIGLIEMTRQRTRKSHETMSFRECPYCSGLGRVKTKSTIAIETVRRLHRAMHSKRSPAITLNLHPDVAEEMQANFNNSLKDLERRFRKRIHIKADTKLHVEDVHIE